MVVHIGAREARNGFAEILGKVHYGHEAVIVERSGKPMVAIVPIEVYEQFVAEREARFEILDRIREHLPEVPVEEVEQDVSEALAAVRADAARRA
jgi:prevent-host-death family protein